MVLVEYDGNMITEHKRKNKFTKSTLKSTFTALKKISFFAKQQSLNHKIAKKEFYPTISGWNNNLKPTKLNNESEYLKAKGLTYVQISPIK